jgi:hypothetical protein
MTELTDIELKLRACATKPCARFWARQLVQAQWEAWENMMSHMSHANFEALVKLHVEQWENDHE